MGGAFLITVKHLDFDILWFLHARTCYWLNKVKLETYKPGYTISDNVLCWLVSSCQKEQNFNITSTTLSYWKMQNSVKILVWWLWLGLLSSRTSEFWWIVKDLVCLRFLIWALNCRLVQIMIIMLVWLQVF